MSHQQLRSYGDGSLLLSFKSQRNTREAYVRTHNPWFTKKSTTPYSVATLEPHHKNLHLAFFKSKAQKAAWTLNQT